MPLSTGKAYLEQFTDDPVAQRALLACAAALRLDDESATGAIDIVAQANGQTRELLHKVKNLGCVWKQWDGSWYLAEGVRRELVDELYQRVPREQIAKLRGYLSERASWQAARMPLDGQITTHWLRDTLIESGYQRIFIPDQVEQGGEQLGAIWEKATPSAGEATARCVDYLAPEIEAHIGQLPVQLLFLRGMAARERGDRVNQEVYFRMVWEKGRLGRIFAMAAHFFGRLVNDHRTAERALRDGLEWDATPTSQAHILHSLGNLIAKNKGRLREAEKAYRKSLDLDPDVLGKAHVAASLASLLSKYRDRKSDYEAEQLALRSLDFDQGNPWTNGVCYRVLADIYERRGDYLKAIEAVNSLIENDNQLGDTRYAQRRQDQLARLRHAISESGTDTASSG